TCRGWVNAPSGRISVYVAAYLRKEGLFVLYAFCPDWNFEKQVPAFEAIAGSFRTDADKANERTDDVKKLFEGIQIGETGKTCRLGGGGALAVIVIGAFVLRGK